MAKKEHLSIPELAKILGISRIAVYKRVKKGQIKAEKIGRNYAIPQKYVTTLLGKELNEEDKKNIDQAIKKTIKEYGEVLRMLGQDEEHLGKNSGEHTPHLNVGYRKIPIIGIIRGANLDNIEKIVEAGFAGGISKIEITLNSEKALEQIKLVSKKYEVGAGTVLTLDECKAAIGAGAKFIVSPITNPEMIKYCKEKKVPIYPCGVTPNEVYQASKLGATMVKIFPVKSFGGPNYIKELKDPFDKIKLLACGGVRPDNIKEYFAAGASAVAIGGSIFGSGDSKEIKKAAQEYFQASSQLR